jgi:pyruvate/2-oxoglutarate/acetoin dehydrogenase E1 component/TPP-dependent pyruvate/acetoin dehydrogenase alpha subunit
MLKDSIGKETRSTTDRTPTTKVSLDPATVLKDFELCCISREASLLARKEVLTGKAKFGITGDGKEVLQVAMAKCFQPGDFRAGYYRDQTLMFALELAAVEDYFAQLYADADNDPFSGGRQMNGHFATPLIDENGHWLTHRDRYNVSADLSSTGGQMGRALGLALASKIYRSEATTADNPFSRHGDEVCFCTIGDASTSEGVFWETLNAAGVLQTPLAVFVFDDGYGISVPKQYQTVKSSISEALRGFQSEADRSGLDIYVVKGWDYAAMVELFVEGIARVRRTHTPALFHIEDLTQPQGHSTSGSHERYKSKERLRWEREHDCLPRMEQWIIAEGIAEAEETAAIRERARKYVRECRDRAWKAFCDPTRVEMRSLQEIYQTLPAEIPKVEQLRGQLSAMVQPLLSELLQNARRMSYALMGKGLPEAQALQAWIKRVRENGHRRYRRHLYAQGPRSAISVPVVAPRFSERSPMRNGFEILNAFFDRALERYPNLYAFGEDVGQIGDVNQGFAGLQKKYGESRVFDTGIREWTIVGQAIGMAMRGLRPIAEIQYLDYLIYGLEPLTDDLATLRWRSNGQQMAPAIIRTRGHRLEGIWHAGSPIAMILNALRGMYLLAPRNMTQAAGMYNTLLQSDDPALVIECLNGYRLKERLPDNIGEYTVPLGVVDVLRAGADLTLVTYGACARIALAACELLEAHGVSIELIDVQTLLPFDLEHRIVQSLRKTNRVLFLDEDVPGGASAYMMREVLEVQDGYRYLDSPPATLTAQAHRTPYGSDGDYFTKPNVEDIFEKIVAIVSEAEPGRFR